MSDIKRARFIKVAEARISKILEMVRLLKNCSNTSNYSYTEAEVEYMFSQINKALKEAKDAYMAELTKGGSTKFSFNNNH